MSGTAMTCEKCGVDVAHGKRLRDSKGRYFCESCAAALRARAAEKLGPLVVGGVSSVAGTTADGSIAAPEPMDDGIFALADEARAQQVPTIGLGRLQTCPDCGHPLGTGSDICQGHLQ